ncbi:xanthine dehydrogenase family protein molybdopterin-binding subunit [Desulfitobacterium hafniense]|nr:xanthine dehydrogenase family protein molybdopterin-binding subunit [Desulfitobacterium hafniense]
MYSSDYKMPGMLHGVILRSPYASADIVDIDTSAAEAMTGVKLVMTYKNFPSFCATSVQYVGYPVACVVALTEEIAEKAMELIKVEYKPKPFVIDPVEALDPDSPRVFPDTPNAYPFKLNSIFTDPNEKGLFTKRELAECDGYGDLEAGFKEADIIVEDDGYSFATQHAPVPERRGALVDYDGERITMYVVTQSAQSIRNALCWSTVGITSPLKVRILSEFNSGTFGARGDDAGFWPDGSPDDPVAFMGGGHDKSSGFAIMAAMTLRKPVRIFYTSNEENFFHFWGRGSANVKVRMGFKKDGTLTAWDQEELLNCGQFGNRWTLFFRNGTPMFMYSHNLPATRIKKTALLTNIPGMVGWSGYGNPEVMFATEQVMDIAAEKLGMDPVELRKKNCAMPGDNALNCSQAYMFTGANWFGSADYPQLLDKLAAQIGWEKRKPHTEKTGVIRSGMGMALTCQQCAGEGVGANALVKLNVDGTAEICVTYADIGQGGRSACRQMTAEALNISFDKVRVVAGDTDATVWGTCNACSGGTVKYGWAVYNACQDALKDLFALGAPVLGVFPEELATENGEIYVKADPSKRMPWAGAFFNQHNNEADPYQIIGKSTWSVPAGAKNIEKAATFCSLDVDTETGELKNVKFYHCADVGRALNDKDTRAQLLRIHHGWESALGGTMRLDSATGKLLNGNYIDYPVATMWECDVEPSYIESGENDPSHPYGAVGLGQALQNAVHAAAANAIYNATGVRIKQVPMTPDVILKALGKI